MKRLTKVLAITSTIILVFAVVLGSTMFTLIYRNAGPIENTEPTDSAGEMHTTETGSPEKNLLENVTMNDVNVDNEKANRWIFKVGDAKVHAQVNSSLPPLLMSFELVKTKGNVSATLVTFFSDPEVKTEKIEAKRSVDLASSNMIYYDIHRTTLDLIKITFFDGQNIIGCALFTVSCGDELSYSLKKAVEFPKVDGNYQNITDEQVEAVFASVDSSNLFLLSLTVPVPLSAKR